MQQFLQSQQILQHLSNPQTQLFQCHREERSDVAISLIHLKRLPRPFRARNDIVKIYSALIIFPENLKYLFYNGMTLLYF